MCTSPVQPICTFSCTAHFISLHILPLILFHYLFLTSFSPYLYIYIYSLVFLFHSFYCFYVIFILLSCFIFLSCTFHWADLSWLTFHYLWYPVWLCMWQIIKNLEHSQKKIRKWPCGYVLFRVDQPDWVHLTHPVWSVAPSFHYPNGTNCVVNITGRSPVGGRKKCV